MRLRFSYRTLQDRCDPTASCLKTICVNGCVNKIKYNNDMLVFKMKRLAGIESPSLKYSDDYVDDYPGPRTLVDKIHPHFLNI